MKRIIKWFNWFWWGEEEPHGTDIAWTLMMFVGGFVGVTVAIKFF